MIFGYEKDLHPKYYEKAEVTCACGAKFIIGSTLEKINVEICSQCHPFYTGQTKIMDAAGRVQKFEERLKRQQSLKSKKLPKAEKSKTKAATKKQAK